MRKTQINLGNYQFYCEHYKNGVDFDDAYYQNKFVMLRKFEIYNDVLYDRDIFFIERSIYDKLPKESSTDLIAYPIHNFKGVTQFSDLGELYSYYNLSNIEDFAYHVRCKETNDLIKCDKIRIYNPTIKKDLEYIIYIDNYINGIHFHYLCNLNKNYEKKYEKEFDLNHNKFIEFLEIPIPSLNFLFDEVNKVYFDEDFNKIKTTTGINDYFVSKIEESNKDNNYYFSTLIKPYFIDKNEKIYIVSDEYNNDFVNKSLNITLYPYGEIANNIYSVNSSIPPTTTAMNSDDYYFRLSSNLGFVDGNIAILNNFIFPGKLKNKNSYSSAEEAEQYENLVNTQIARYYNSYYINENIDNIERESYKDEIDIEEIRTTGFLIQFAIDLDFKQIIYESKINTDNVIGDNFIYDFSFSLNNLFESWNQLNDILIARTTFIDKKLGIFIRGNNVVITKEYFKYFMVDAAEGRVIYPNQNNLINVKFMDVSYGFNLINKIDCVIQDKETKTNSSVINETNTNTTIVYKPIFYKVQDLQNIRFRQGVKQNIGINLGAFMTKVDTFILNIEGKNYPESSRNDVFVIFAINSNNLEEVAGSYNILDQNYEYISSGNYTLY